MQQRAVTLGWTILAYRRRWKMENALLTKYNPGDTVRVRRTEEENRLDIYDFVSDGQTPERVGSAYLVGYR